MGILACQLLEPCLTLIAPHVPVTVRAIVRPARGISGWDGEDDVINGQRQLLPQLRGAETPKPFAAKPRKRRLLSGPDQRCLESLRARVSLGASASHGSAQEVDVTGAVVDGYSNGNRKKVLAVGAGPTRRLRTQPEHRTFPVAFPGGRGCEHHLG